MIVDSGNDERSPPCRKIYEHSALILQRIKIKYETNGFPYNLGRCFNMYGYILTSTPLRLILRASPPVGLFFRVQSNFEDACLILLGRSISRMAPVWIGTRFVNSIPSVVQNNLSALQYFIMSIKRLCTLDNSFWDSASGLTL
jgi:hypothetical protein